MRKINIIIATLICVINAYFMGRFVGFEKGYFVGIDIFKEFQKYTISERGTINSILADFHFYIFLLIAIYILGKAFGSKLIPQLMCLVSLLLTLFCYFRMYISIRMLDANYIKNLSQSTIFHNFTFSVINSENCKDVVYQIVCDSILIDWICVFAIFYLLIMETVVHLPFQHIRKVRRQFGVICT